MTRGLAEFARILVVLTLVFAAAPARAQSEWDGVSRVIIIGDLHGDYAKFADILGASGLTDANGDWIGGSAHLVQLGDVPDRAPDTRRILDELMRLERQARRAGGYVHALIGNHEAMNVEGDLRYTTAGEFAAFADRGSARLRAQYYNRTLDYIRSHPPAQGMPALDDTFRAQWEATHPLGYVEHRRAWAADGTYGRWVAGHDAVIRINDTLYMHGGLGPSFLYTDRDTLNRAVRAALRGHPLAGYQDILTNEEGPLWYRGLALNLEDSERTQVDALLARHGVAHIALGHTKRGSAVFPRFGGRVLLTDIAVPPGYSDPHAYLIQENGAFIVVHRGHRVALTATTPAEACMYLAQVAAIDPPGGPVSMLAANCNAPNTVAADAN